MSVHYGAIHAVKKINLELHQGEIVTLLGSNGAGKTTTLHTISGLLNPSSGEILFNGTPIHRMPAHRITALGLAQSPEGRQVFANLSIKENLEMGAYLRHDKKGIEEDFEFVFSDGRKERSPFNRFQIEGKPYDDFILNWGFDFIIPIHCALFKSEVIIENKIIFDETLKAREDWLFWIALAKHEVKFSFIYKTLAFYRKHNESMAHDQSHMLKNTLMASYRVYESLSPSQKLEFENKYSNYLLENTKAANRKYTELYNSRILKIYRKVKSLFL